LLDVAVGCGCGHGRRPQLPGATIARGCERNRRLRLRAQPQAVGCGPNRKPQLLDVAVTRSCARNRRLRLQPSGDDTHGRARSSANSSAIPACGPLRSPAGRSSPHREAHCEPSKTPPLGLPMPARRADDRRRDEPSGQIHRQADPAESNRPRASQNTQLGAQQVDNHSRTSPADPTDLNRPSRSEQLPGHCQPQRACRGGGRIGQEPSRAELGKAEPAGAGRARPSRAEPGRFSLAWLAGLAQRGVAWRAKFGVPSLAWLPWRGAASIAWLAVCPALSRPALAWPVSLAWLAGRLAEWLVRRRPRRTKPACPTGHGSRRVVRSTRTGHHERPGNCPPWPSTRSGLARPTIRWSTLAQPNTH
jgi:hypothetical protein